MVNFSTRRCRAVAGRVGMVAALLAASAGGAWADAITFTPGDLVVSVEGNGGGTAAGGTGATGNNGANANTYLDNQAAPVTLYEFNTTGTNQTPVGTLTLPTANAGGNSAFAGEYGSQSEGGLQLTGNGQYLTIAGYATNPATYNSNSDVNGTGTALAQSCSLSSITSCGGTPQVARVIAVIGNDSVDTSTVLNNIYNENNPRSVYSANGTSFYISGQGTGNAGDTTGGVFYVPSTGPGQTPVAITGQDATTSTTNTSQDTRAVQVFNNTLYVSADTKEGKNSARDFVGTLGTPPATSLYNGAAGQTMLPGFGNTGGTGKVTITSGAHSNGNGLNAGAQINLSPEDFFFANPTTLYVADSGSPKNDSNATSKGVDLGDGGLQKWSLVSGTWVLDYTLAAGLGLVDNATDGGTAGTTGLEGLTGEVVGGTVELFATTYTIGDLDPSFLYAITDVLADTVNPGTETFAELAEAPADSDFKGVAFAPVPEPSSLAILGAALFGLTMLGRRRRRTL